MTNNKHIFVLLAMVLFVATSVVSAHTTSQDWPPIDYAPEIGDEPSMGCASRGDWPPID